MYNKMITYKELSRKVRKIGAQIIEKEKEFLGSLGRSLGDFGEDKFGKKYEDTYYKSVGLNLWAGEGGEEKYPHFEAYGRGSGEELKDKKVPAKMKCIRSSSAMTYNLLGNNRIELCDGKDCFSKGSYTVEYEKQLFTIRRNLNPANLDAYLYNEDSKEAIFCEMKMMEWIYDTPGSIADAYEDEKRYFANVEGGGKTVEAFQKAICMLKEAMPVLGSNKHFFRYDAWQMFKHTLGIYNMTSELTRKEIDILCAKREDSVRIIPPCRKITLVNVVFEPAKEILSLDVQDSYAELLKIEHDDFATFRRIMMDSGIYDAFERDCHLEFELKYMTVAEFMDCFDVLDRRCYLERYIL